MIAFLKCHSQQSTCFQGDNKMKTIILITTVFLSQLSLAGTGGGGVMAATGKTMQDGSSVGAMKLRPSLNPEIVLNIGNQNGIVRIAHGQFVDNKWQIQQLEIPEVELTTDATVIKALQDSNELKNWVQIK